VDSIARPGSQTPPIIDFIDWHIYGHYTAEEIEDGAAALEAFCSVRDVGWTVLETYGPETLLPVDSICPDSLEYCDPGMTIKATLVCMRASGHYEAQEILESLFDWTRDYDDSNLALPENKGILEELKDDEFDDRVVTLIEGGAAAVHWFGAYEQCLLPADCDPDPWPEIFSIESVNSATWVDNLIRKTQSINHFIMDRYGSTHHQDTCCPYFAQPTPLSNRMKAYIDSVYQNAACNPDSQENRQGYSDGSHRQLTGPLRLYPNYPDPFNASTQIRYYLPEEMDARLEVYDILGRRVRLLLNERQSAGQHSIICNSSAFASGIYFYQLTAEGRPLVGRMTSLK